MKLLIATRCDKKIRTISDLTHPLIKEYAEKCGADFLELTEEPPIWTNENPPRPHYRIMEFYNLFEKYDRIASIDTDLLINKNCPNIFETVDNDCIGSIYEDVGDSASHRRGQIKKVQEQFGNVGWETGYINTGFTVFSKCHRDIFQPIDGKYFMDFGYDDVHLAYQAHRFGFKFQELDFKWNHMTMFSRPWNNYSDRFKSYIIHYAGEGVFDKPEVKNRFEQIKNDLKVIKGM